ncbi:MAG: hypothetical protein H7Y32_04135 [Chloroflexales bacterium]|nr:hypothetical protein [Chloroflexales bacterium]
MPTSYNIDRNRRLVQGGITGIFTQAEAIALNARLKADPQFDPTFRSVWDLTAVTAFALTGNAVRALAQRSVFAPTARCAFVEANDVGYGLGRMFATLRECAGAPHVAVFRDTAAAWRWLEARDPVAATPQ